MATKTKEPKVYTSMDEAAEDALESLKKRDPKVVMIVATWWKDWYLKAGHKRLGRGLLKYLKDRG